MNNPKPLDLDFKKKWNMKWCDYCCWYDKEGKRCSVFGHPGDFGDDKTLSHTALCFLNRNHLKDFNLEDIKKWVKQDLVVKEGNIDRAIDLTINKIKQQIKERCEFYLKYKDNPELLIKEHPKYEDEVVGMCFAGWDDYYRKNLIVTVDYNKWLFKLAFKGVLDEQKKDILGRKTKNRRYC